MTEAPTAVYDGTLEPLIEQFTEPLMRAALALGFAPTDAEELVQDTFVTFLKARDRFEGRSALSTYLFGILYNKARELRRSKDRERTEEAIEQVFDAHFDSNGHWNDDAKDQLTEPERWLHVEEIKRFLAACLENLTMPLRIVFTLKEIEGAATSTICDQLQLTPNHVGVLLFRARNQMRECLKTKRLT